MQSQLQVNEFQQLLEDIRCSRLTAFDALAQFEAWMQAVERSLQAASEELQPGAWQIDGPEQAALDQFERSQRRIREHLKEIGALFRACDTLEQFQIREAELDQKLLELEASRRELEEALASVEPAADEHGPLPELVRDCLDHLQAGLSRLVNYAELRESEELEQLALELDLAQRSLREFMQKND